MVRGEILRKMDTQAGQMVTYAADRLRHHMGLSHSLAHYMCILSVLAVLCAVRSGS